MTRSSITRSACLVIVGTVLSVAAIGCAPRASRPVRVPRNSVIDATGFPRVLVAGFASMPLAGVDANEETSRLLRRALRMQTSARVVDVEPLHLGREVLSDVPFWRRLGEEYDEPLIVTGVVDFKSAGHYYQPPSGRRGVGIWFPQYSLTVRLFLIDGRTGERIGSAVCGPTIAHAASGRERALTVYYRLIARTMPSILGVLVRRTSLRSAPEAACRRDADDERAPS